MSDFEKMSLSGKGFDPEVEGRKVDLISEEEQLRRLLGKPEMVTLARKILDDIDRLSDEKEKLDVLRSYGEGLTFGPPKVSPSRPGQEILGIYRNGVYIGDVSNGESTRELKGAVLEVVLDNFFKKV
jgi:hypothetical protein